MFEVVLKDRLASNILKFEVKAPAVAAKRKFLRDFLDTASDIPASLSLAAWRRNSSNLLNAS